MAIHVTIGEAEKRLSELFSAAQRGESVVVSEADGAQISFVPVARTQPLTDEERERIRRQRRSAFGMFRHLVSDPDVEVPPSMTDEELEERWRRKFGPAA